MKPPFVLKGQRYCPSTTELFTPSATAPHQRIRWALWILLLSLLTGPALAQEGPPVVPPSVERAAIEIERGRDIVQPLSLWYQEGTKPPDSLGVLRVPCCGTGEPDAITYPDAVDQFPVNLQVAIFVRDGQIAEVPISTNVLRGVTPGRIIIRSAPDDYYDIAEPFGVEPIKQVPGDETIIDVRAWYQAALQTPSSETMAPADEFHTIRELRGQLRSTAREGESVYFVIVAGRVEPPVVTLTPIPPERVVAPVLKATIDLRLREMARPRLDWTTTTALLAGPNRADLPGRPSSTYNAFRVRGHVESTLRWHANPTESYSFTVFGSSQPTFAKSDSHHDVPYGLSLSARFGAARAIELRAEASYEDDPFQAQGFQSGDERLRLMLGYDYETATTRRRVSIGPTYFRDQTSVWERNRTDARELGFTLEGLWGEQVKAAGFTTTIRSLVAINQSWGYIQDAGTRNTTLEGRLAIKPNFSVGSTRMEFGPAAYVQYVSNDYDTMPGFTELNAQAGLELTTHIKF